MATAGTGSDAPESARARRARIKAEREAALAAAIARGLTPEQAQRAVDEEARAEARARAWDGRPSVPAAEAGGIPSLRAPEPLRAPAVAAPPPREPGPSEGTIGRFLSPSKVPGRIGNLLYLAALANIAAAIVRPWRNRMPEVATYLPGAVEGYVVAFAILSGLFLLLVARAVKRGKARGWWAAVMLLSLLLVFDVAEGELPRRPIATTLTVLALALLLVFRRQFAAASDPTTRWRALWVFLGLLVSSLLAGAAFVRVESRHLFEVRNLGWTDALIAAATGMLGQDLNDLAVTPTPRLQVISNVLIVLGLVTVLVPVWLFLRSPRQVGTIDADDDRRMRLLLAAHPDSLGYFNTRQDKDFVWSESGKSGIGYRVVSGVILASGDPLGDPEAWPGAIAAFLELADSHGWTPGVLGCSELGGTIWVRETGFQALEIGDEAIVDTTEFSLDGREMRNVRQMVNRIRRQGYETEMMRVRDTPVEWRAKALADASAWRVGGTERGFSMATSRVFDADRDPDAIVIVATREGIVEGMLQFAPWGHDGMSLDLMRRNPAADPGINELLIVDALSKAPGLGVRRVSLNFAMFRSTFERGEKLGAGPILKAWRRLLQVGNRWFQLESLYRFNAKFRPVWYPRFVIYPRAVDIVRVGLAAGRAEAFIVFPRLTLPFRGGR